MGETDLITFLKQKPSLPKERVGKSVDVQSSCGNYVINSDTYASVVKRSLAKTKSNESQ